MICGTIADCSFSISKGEPRGSVPDHPLHRLGYLHCCPYRARPYAFRQGHRRFRYDCQLCTIPALQPASWSKTLTSSRLSSLWSLQSASCLPCSSSLRASTACKPSFIASAQAAARIYPGGRFLFHGSAGTRGRGAKCMPASGSEGKSRLILSRCGVVQKTASC